MRSIPALLLFCTASLIFSSCAVTGNPTQGGIFWSESMAQDRLAQRQQTLNEIESDTARREARSRELEKQLR